MGRGRINIMSAVETKETKIEVGHRVNYNFYKDEFEHKYAGIVVYVYDHECVVKFGGEDNVAPWLELAMDFELEIV